MFLLCKCLHLALMVYKYKFLPFLRNLRQAMITWASAGECKRGHCPNPTRPIKIVCYLHFFEENSIFLGVFWANSMFLHPLENFALPGKKSADARDEVKG